MPLLFFFPFLTPALRFLAALAPDRGLRRLRAARAVIMQTAFALMRDHRAVLAKEVRALVGTHAASGCCWLCAKGLGLSCHLRSM